MTVCALFVTYAEIKLVTRKLEKFEYNGIQIWEIVEIFSVIEVYFISLNVELMVSAKNITIFLQLAKF
jgi:hypothetical protein